VQTIVITTIVAFVIFALGLVLNYSLKDHDKAEHLAIDQIDGNEMTRNNVIHRSKISAPVRAISVTAASSTLLLDENNNRKIIGLVLVGTLFTGFYVMIIVCLNRRQTRLHKRALLAYNTELENDNNLQNIATNIQGNKIGWMKLPNSMI
jgi:multisubunit Na+/H+ antiporter MnhC subunit